MTSDQKYEGTVEEWDSGVLGSSEAHVVVAASQDKALDEALGLHPISIRIQQSLLDDLKALAQLNGIGYQPLIRQVLTRWVDAEKRCILMDQLQQRKAGIKVRTSAVSTRKTALADKSQTPEKRPETAAKRSREKVAA